MDKERLIIIAISALIGLIIIATAVILIVRTYTDMPEDTAQSSAITPAGDTTSAPFETSGTSVDSYGTDSSPHEQATSGSTPADSGTNAPESAQITSSNAETHSITTASPVTTEAPVTTETPVTAAPPVSTEAAVTTQPTETSAITEADTSSPAETTYPDGVTGGKHTFVISADSKGSFRLLSNTGKMDDRIYPASLTKLVTALTVLEYAGNRLDDVITVGETELKLVKAGSSLADLSAGMKLTVRQMLECMLIPSGNDAAYVLASYVGGLIDPSAKTASQRVSVFVGKMNEWSASNALMNSSWKNPDGYHADGHYTSMNDMVVIVMQTINNMIGETIYSDYE
ncbi:MAG: serine hydrolase, partial [Clostridia bacterium]|nr:serine hydrolase [Clostridia bacterium]